MGCYRVLLGFLGCRLCFLLELTAWYLFVGFSGIGSDSMVFFKKKTDLPSFLVALAGWYRVFT